MKRFIITLVLGFVMASVAQADEFFLQANVPASNGVNYVVSKVTGNNFVKQTPGFNDLDFGTLVLTDVGNNQFVFLATHYWVIDVAPNGATNPDIDITYADTSNPTGVALGSGLATHAAIGWAEIIAGNPEVQNPIASMGLGQANGQTVLDSTFADGFLRFSVGIATGDPNLDEGNAVPFTASNVAGDYLGTLELSATFNP